MKEFIAAWDEFERETRETRKTTMWDGSDGYFKAQFHDFVQWLKIKKL